MRFPPDLLEGICFRDEPDEIGLNIQSFQDRLVEFLQPAKCSGREDDNRKILAKPPACATTCKLSKISEGPPNQLPKSTLNCF